MLPLQPRWGLTSIHKAPHEHCTLLSALSLFPVRFHACSLFANHLIVFVLTVRCEAVLIRKTEQAVQKHCVKSQSMNCQYASDIKSVIRSDLQRYEASSAIPVEDSFSAVSIRNNNMKNSTVLSDDKLMTSPHALLVEAAARPKCQLWIMLDGWFVSTRARELAELSSRMSVCNQVFAAWSHANRNSGGGARL